MSPSCLVPAHGMTSPVLFQQVVCPVAGNACAAARLVLHVARLALHVFRFCWHCGTPPGNGCARTVPAQHTRTAATATTPVNPCRLVVIFGLTPGSSRHCEPPARAAERQIESAVHRRLVDREMLVSSHWRLRAWDREDAPLHPL